MAILFQICLLVISADFPFFWDSIQFGSRHATYFHTEGVGWLPTVMDSGNPPLLGLLVHVDWLIFGRSLIASHAVIWPFAMANLGLLALLGHTLARPHWGWLPLLWIANPIYAAQTTLVSPDVLLVSGLLCLWVGRQFTWNWMITFGSLILGAVSLRSLALLGTVGVWWLLDRDHRMYVKWVLLGAAPGLLYHLCHGMALGWVFVPLASPWSGSFNLQTLQALPRNAAILIWRLMDHGLGFLWIGLSVAWYFHGHRTPTTRKSAIWLLVMIMAVFPFFLFFSSLNMHRYLLPVSLAGTILFVQLNPSRTIRWAVCILLVLGNLWIYPDRIAQGWDATLAWMSYPAHRQSVLEEMDARGIAWEMTSSAFPNLGPSDELTLDGDSRSFTDWTARLPAQYLFYSNVFNDFSDQDLDRMITWPIVIQSGHWPVKVILYEIPRDETNSY
ncbi:MAG: hypothetical protein K9I85_00330 [Saprospiraceae bacterium]|nr:hypothetical protein [Saprospiraceae bacterium]